MPGTNTPEYQFAPAAQYEFDPPEQSHAWQQGDLTVDSALSGGAVQQFAPPAAESTPPPTVPDVEPEDLAPPTDESTSDSIEPQDTHEDTDDDSLAADDQVPVADTSTETETETESAEPAFDPIMLNAAKMTAEEAKQYFKTPQELQDAVRRHDYRTVEKGRDYLAPHQTYPSAQSPQKHAPQAPEGQPPVQPSADVTPGTVQPFQLPEGREWSDEARALHEAFNKFHEDQMRGLGSQLQRHEEALQQEAQDRERAEQRRQVEAWETFLGNLGPEWESVFGKGAIDDLPEGLLRNNRVAGFEVATQLATGAQLEGRPPMPLNELFARSLSVAFPRHEAQTVRSQVNQELQKRQRMKTQRPTARRNTTRMTPEEKAVQNAEKWYDGNPQIHDAQNSFVLDEV